MNAMNVEDVESFPGVKQKMNKDAKRFMLYVGAIMLFMSVSASCIENSGDKDEEKMPAPVVPAKTENSALDTPAL